MAEIPTSVSQFLEGHRIGVAGVSRHKEQAANAVYRKLKESGYEVFPINPKATEVEGDPCFPDLASVPGSLDGVMIVTHPDVAADIVRQGVEQGVQQVWFHRSFGSGSVSEEAIRLAEEAGMNCIVGGCPLMFLAPVDFAHRCMCWWLQRRGRVPAAA
jgi:predicted CoA-binding protein